MSNEYSVGELFAFLEHAADRGLMPAATAQALAVASRNVFAVLDDGEQHDVRKLDLTAVAKRFTNKRARDFSPDTLREYERRVKRAVNLFVQWRDDPASFRAPTRSTAPGRRRTESAETENLSPAEAPAVRTDSRPPVLGTYETSIPLAPGRIVTLLNVPEDLTNAEAKRLADFVQMLAVEQP